MIDMRGFTGDFNSLRFTGDFNSLSFTGDFNSLSFTGDFNSLSLDLSYVPGGPNILIQTAESILGIFVKSVGQVHRIITNV